MSNPFDQLHFVRGFNRSSDLVGLFHLFGANERSSSYVVGQTTQEVRYRPVSKLIARAEVEPLEFRHAREMATGSGYDISLEDLAALTFPGRYLFADNPHLKLLTRQQITVEWLLDGLIETPCFYASLLNHEITNIVDNQGFPVDVRPEVLRASAAMKP